MMDINSFQMRVSFKVFLKIYNLCTYQQKYFKIYFLHIQVVP